MATYTDVQREIGGLGRPRLTDGVAGGVCGGVLMGTFSMILFPLLGVGGFWQPMNLIAAVFNQDWGSIKGFAMVPVLVGMMVHLMTSAALGMLFAWVAGRRRGTVLLRAVSAALVIWLVSDFLVLPIIDPVLTRVYPEWLFALAHVMFGLGLGAYLRLRGGRLSEPRTVGVSAAGTT